MSRRRRNHQTYVGTTVGALDVERAAVSTRDLTDDREAEARVCGSRPEVLWVAVALVGDRDDRATERGAHVDLDVTGAVPDRVVDKVRHSPVEAGGVAGDLDGSRRRQLDAPTPGRRRAP